MSSKFGTVQNPRRRYTREMRHGWTEKKEIIERSCTRIFDRPDALQYYRPSLFYMNNYWQKKNHFHQVTSDSAKGDWSSNRLFASWARSLIPRGQSTFEDGKRSIVRRLASHSTLWPQFCFRLFLFFTLVRHSVRTEYFIFFRLSCRSAKWNITISRGQRDRSCCTQVMLKKII